jgi:hypothetical protein
MDRRHTPKVCQSFVDGQGRPPTYRWSREPLVQFSLPYEMVCTSSLALLFPRRFPRPRGGGTLSVGMEARTRTTNFVRLARFVTTHTTPASKCCHDGSSQYQQVSQHAWLGICVLVLWQNLKANGFDPHMGDEGRMSRPLHQYGERSTTTTRTDSLDDPKA